MVTSSRRHQGRSGPRRREYQRAAYRARLLGETTHGGNPHDIDRSGQAPDRREWEELIACGAQMCADADTLAASRIAATETQRPHVDAREVTRARTLLTKARADWLYIHEETRTQFPSATDLTEREYLHDKLSDPELRWRRAALAAYRDTTDQFLDIAARAYGHDINWGQRMRIRADSYRNVISTRRPVRAVGSIVVPEEWGSNGDLAAASTRPTISAALTLFAEHHRTPGITIPDGQLLAAGSEALFEGSYGGLVGDGEPYIDDTIRAFILATWGTL